MGNSGEKELQVFQEPEAKFYLSTALKEADPNVVEKQVLGTDGVVIAPNLNLNKKIQRRIVHEGHGMYSDKYPCRIFNYY